MPLLRRLFPRSFDEILVPPVAESIPLDLQPIANKSDLSLLWRRFRPALHLRLSGQHRLEMDQFDSNVHSVLWIYKGTPQIGDALMDLASRILLKRRGIRVDLLSDPFTRDLFGADEVFSRVFTGDETIDAGKYDAVVLNTFKARSIRSKLRSCSHLPYATMLGYFSGPEFNRTLFGFHRMNQILGTPFSPQEIGAIARPYLYSSQHDRQVISEALAIPEGAVGIAVGGASPERTYAHWNRVVDELAASGVSGTSGTSGACKAIVLFGSANGKPVRDEIVRGTQHGGIEIIDCVDRYTIVQTMELMRRCKLVVSADGGLLHVAHAAGVPTVSLFHAVLDPALRITPATRSTALRSSGDISAIPHSTIAAAIRRTLDT